MQRFRVTEEEEGRLDQFLCDKLGISKKQAKAFLDARVVFVNGRRTWIAKSELVAGDAVEVHELPTVQTTSDERILYEDDQLLIVDKQSGIASNGAASLEDQLRKLTKIRELCAVHRLDKDTSGCLILAKSQAAKDEMEQLFRQKSIEKVYHVLVEGCVASDIVEITMPIEGRSALSKLQVLSSNKIATHLRVIIATGRMHQIRRHMLAIGHPVVGDKQYGIPSDSKKIFREATRQMLHARSVSFVSPWSSAQVNVKAKLPSDFLVCMQKLGLN